MDPKCIHMIKEWEKPPAKNYQDYKSCFGFELFSDLLNNT